MIRVVAFGLVSAFTFSAAAQERDGPVGEWQRQDGGSAIEISRCGEDLCAINSWVRDPDGDEKVGDLLVLSVRPTASGKFEGLAHDERRDKTYAMTLTLSPAGLQTEGCVLFGLLCKNAAWIRPQ